VTDPAIIEAAARAIYNNGLEWHDCPDEWYREMLSVVLAAVTPLIRADALEEAARAFEFDGDGHDAHSYRWTAGEIAAAIRALIPPADDRT
jgi:hypothetical protein